MTASQYAAALRKLGLTSYSAGPLLGISRRQSYRYAAGDQPVPDVVMKLLQMMIAEADRCGRLSRRLLGAQNRTKVAQ